MGRPIKNPDGHKLILDTARALLIEQGPDKLTARNIAKAAGYGVGSVYFYFSNIDDLTLQINGETLGQLYTRLSTLDAQLAHSPGKLSALCHYYFDFAFDNKELWGAVMNYRRTGEEWSGALYKERVDMLMELVAKIITPHLRPGQNPTEMSLVLWAGMQGIWLVSLREGFKTVSRAEAKKMVETLVKNLFN